MIVLVIVGVLAFLGTNMVSGTFKSKSRELAWRMASTIRFLYNSAITENKTVRLVFDFESNSYWAEVTSEKFLLDKSGEEVKKEETKTEEAKEQKDEKDENTASVMEPIEPTFGSMESPYLETRQIATGVFIKDVYTGHDKEPVTAGRAYIYFFPNGYAEPAVINFKDEADEKHLSVKINPFNGEADLSKEYRKLGSP